MVRQSTQINRDLGRIACHRHEPHVRSREILRQLLSEWDVSRLKNMCGMFLGATSFNGDMSRWGVSSVNDMLTMFLYAILECVGLGVIGKKNPSTVISEWDVSCVRNMHATF